MHRMGRVNNLNNLLPPFLCKSSFFLALKNAGRKPYSKDKHKSDSSSYGSAILPTDTS